MSRTTAPVPSIASAQARVAVAMPDRWVRKLSIVRSAPSTAGAGPLTRSTASPGPIRAPSGTSAAQPSRQLAAGPSRYHPIRSSTASATGTPASTPASRATTSAVTVRPATVAADVTSGPYAKSSSSAAPTTRATSSALSPAARSVASVSPRRPVTPWRGPVTSS